MTAITFAAIIKQKAIAATAAANEARAAWRALPKKLIPASAEQMQIIANLKAAEAAEHAIWFLAAKAATGDDACPLNEKLSIVVSLAMKDGNPKDGGGYEIFDVEILQKLASDDDCVSAAIYIRNHWVGTPATLRAV